MAKKRRPRGAGGLHYEDARDRWIGTVTINGRRHRVVAKTKTDAGAKLAKLTAAKTTGASVDDRRYTVADAITTFLERDVPNRRRNGKPLAKSGVVAYRWAGSIVVEHLGRVKLHNLTAGRVEDVFDVLATTKRRKTSKPLSAQSIKRVRTTLHQAIASAVRRGYVTRNVAVGVEIPDAARATRKRKALNPKQARKLLDVLHDEPNGLMFALSLRLGLRPGEASAVIWRDVDGDVLHVRGTKTAGADRYVAMPADVSAWIGEHRAGVARIGKTLMFQTAAGKRIDASNARRWLKKLCERAQVPVVRPNELRHSCASLLSDIGVANEQIADLLGHTTTRMVEQHYRHRLRPVVDVAAKSDWLTGSL